MDRLDAVVSELDHLQGPWDVTAVRLAAILGRSPVAPRPLERCDPSLLR